MSEPEDFLTRWSRRKRAPEPEQRAPTGDAAPEAPVESGEAASEAKPAAVGEPATPQGPVPKFDLGSLPSLDSIDAQTDIRVFLQVGVPNDLRLAALRRAWTADPAIRNFKGLAENDWDFNDPNAMVGFGPLDPGTDIKTMLAQLFGETPRAEEEATALPPAQDQTKPAALNSTEKVVADSEPSDAPASPTSEAEELLQREENIAAQDADEEVDDDHRRSHGGALPH